MSYFRHEQEDRRHCVRQPGACGQRSRRRGQAGRLGVCDWPRAPTSSTTGLSSTASSQSAFSRILERKKHLLRPHDVLVTGRSRAIKVALVPPAVSRTVASVTLLVIRPRFPESGISHWLWYFLTSTIGRSAVERQIRPGMMIPTLPASSLAEVDVPLPSDADLDRLAEFTEASELAYQASLQVARLRREQLRDSLIQEIAGKLRGAK